MPKTYLFLVWRIYYHNFVPGWNWNISIPKQLSSNLPKTINISSMYLQYSFLAQYSSIVCFFSNVVEVSHKGITSSEKFKKLIKGNFKNSSMKQLWRDSIGEMYSGKGLSSLNFCNNVQKGSGQGNVIWIAGKLLRKGY